MLTERTARALHYDSAIDEVRVDVGDPGRRATGRPRTVQGQLLLDAEGFLVGVDLGGEGLARVLVMLGSHEKVARTTATAISVTGDASGTPMEIRIGWAKGAMRGGEPNPYL